MEKSHRETCRTPGYTGGRTHSEQQPTYKSQQYIEYHNNVTANKLIFMTQAQF
jgi:hypothetical protein